MIPILDALRKRESEIKKLDAETTKHTKQIGRIDKECEIMNDKIRKLEHGQDLVADVKRQFEINHTGFMDRQKKMKTEIMQFQAKFQEV